MSFEDNIKKWVMLDNQQKHLNEKMLGHCHSLSELELSLASYTLTF